MVSGLISELHECAKNRDEDKKTVKPSIGFNTTCCPRSDSNFANVLSGAYVDVNTDILFVLSFHCSPTVPPNLFPESSLIILQSK